MWAERVAARFGYSVRFEDIGAVDEEVGAPTQMAQFILAQVKNEAKYHLTR